MADDITVVSSDVEDIGDTKYQIENHRKYLKYIENHANSDSDLDGQYHKHNLTGETLAGPGKISFRSPTYYFIDQLAYGDIDPDYAGDNYSVTFLHLGSKLSGHQQIVHGGLLATLLDELTCLLAFENFESKKGVTANLNINYRRPTYVNNYVLVKCKIIKKIGRKCWVKGEVYLVDLLDEAEIESPENLLTECEVLVIEPKWVKDLQSESKET